MHDAAALAPKPDSAAERVAMAREMAELGLTLARKLTADVVAEAETRPADPALAFSRLSRAVRLTLALEEALEQGALAKAPPPQTDYTRLRGFILKDEAAHRVREMIEAEAEDRGEACDVERLLADLDERLDDPADLEDFARAPLRDSVRRICADLGVTFDAALWDDLAFDDADKFPENLPSPLRGEGPGMGAPRQSPEPNLGPDEELRPDKELNPAPA